MEHSHRAYSPTDLEKVIFTLFEPALVVSHQKKGSKFRLIILQVDLVLVKLEHGVHARDRDIVDSDLAFMTSTHCELLASFSEVEHVNGAT